MIESIWKEILLRIHDTILTRNFHSLSLLLPHFHHEVERFVTLIPIILRSGRKLFTYPLGSFPGIWHLKHLKRLENGNNGTLSLIFLEASLCCLSMYLVCLKTLDHFTLFFSLNTVSHGTSMLDWIWLLPRDAGFAFCECLCPVSRWFSKKSSWIDIPSRSSLCSCILGGCVRN